MWDIVEEIYRAWKVMPTPETLSTDVSRILSECYSFWDEEEEDGPPIIRFEEQDWFEIIQNQLTMYFCSLYSWSDGFILTRMGR